MRTEINKKFKKKKDTEERERESTMPKSSFFEERN